MNLPQELKVLVSFPGVGKGIILVLEHAFVGVICLDDMKSVQSLGLGH